MAGNYKEIAKEVRKQVLTLIHKGGTSHIASCFSAVDMAVVLYENLKPEDEVVWSAGWKAGLIYTMLERQGKITREQLESFPNAPFFGLAEVTVPGVHVSGGSMGQGLGVAIGMALARKREGKPGTIYCIMSDGEMQEGTTWEGAQLAGQHKLDNLVVLIDYNKWTAMGRTEDVADVEPFADKWKAFKWHADRVDGHNHRSLDLAIDLQHGWSDAPSVVICDTIKGKGVKMFEDKILFHYASIDKPTYKAAMKELGFGPLWKSIEAMTNSNIKTPDETPTYL